LRATRDQIKSLEKLHEEMTSAEAAGEITKFQILNLQFHTAMFDAAANVRLREIDVIVRNEMQLYIRQNITSNAQMRSSLAEHGAIIASLKAGESEECAARFERHILNGKQRAIDAGRTASR
jgi:DNA-binding GntR family transcriptional regulator